MRENVLGAFERTSAIGEVVSSSFIKLIMVTLYWRGREEELSKSPHFNEAGLVKLIPRMRVRIVLGHQ